MNHEYRLYKLEACGVRRVSLDWLKSSLSDWSQCFPTIGKVSKALIIACGVPQGSILGPPFFQIMLMIS